MAGSDKTRDHLANERTFLAWVRTSLGLIGLGFVLARMGLFLRELALARPGGGAAPHPGHAGHEFVVSGIIFLAIGTALSGWAGWLYHRNRRAIDSDRFIPAGPTVTALTGFVVLGGLVIAGLTVWRVAVSGG
jgi:putative membrane protein